MQIEELKNLRWTSLAFRVSYKDQMMATGAIISNNTVSLQRLCQAVLLKLRLSSKILAVSFTAVA